MQCVFHHSFIEVYAILLLTLPKTRNTAGLALQVGVRIYKSVYNMTNIIYESARHINFITIILIFIIILFMFVHTLFLLVCLVSEV